MKNHEEVSAVEWQFEQMFNSFEKFNNGKCTFNDYLKRNLEIREQAKEMEKEQRGYSEEDVRLAYFQGEKDSYIKGGQTKEMENEFIQSLQQKHELNKSDKGCACYGSNSLHPCFCNTPLKDKS
jgi:hypothetical protein